MYQALREKIVWLRSDCVGRNTRHVSTFCLHIKMCIIASRGKVGFFFNEGGREFALR